MYSFYVQTLNILIVFFWHIYLIFDNVFALELKIVWIGFFSIAFEFSVWINMVTVDEKTDWFEGKLGCEKHSSIPSPILLSPASSTDWLWKIS